MKKKMHSGFFLTLWLVISAGLAFPHNSFGQTVGCNYYASPTGTGNGLSQSSPFKISNFWAVAKPGQTLCLLDGTYTGSASMIHPPQNLMGQSGAPISVKALNDGKVFINGQGSSIPVMLYYNNWWVIEGVNACCSSESVVQVSHGNNNIVRRVAAWDAADGNTDIFGVHSANYTLLEDVAGWGIARKIFESSQGGNFTTIRRSWGRWEGSHVVGPKTTYELVYNNYDIVVENALGTWSGEQMKETYVLLDYYGQPWTASSRAGTYTNYAVEEPYAIFDVVGNFYDGMDRNARAKLLGSIAYASSTDKSLPGQLVFGTQLDSAAITNTAVYMPSGSFANGSFAGINTFGLHGINGTTATNLRATNFTGIGGSGSSIASVWQPSNGLNAQSPQNIFTATQGANVCYRYQGGILTNQPLWPWPMDQRIKEAMAVSGHRSVTYGMAKDDGYVTTAIENMFGPISAQCKGSGTVTTPVTPNLPPPPPPTTLSGSLTSLKTLSPIAIDGSLNESVWNQANSVTFSNPTQSDNTVKVSTLWDDSNLYFAYDVTDANLETLNDPANLWQDDGAEIYLDTQNDKSTTMDANDYSLRTNINNLVDLIGVTVRTQATARGYTQEIQIPWSVINTNPQAGKILGLLLANNDRDNGVSKQFDWLNVISTRNYAQPNLWGSLTLSGTTVEVTVPNSPGNLLIQAQ